MLYLNTTDFEDQSREEGYQLFWDIRLQTCWIRSPLEDWNENGRIGPQNLSACIRKKALFNVHTYLFFPFLLHQCNISQICNDFVDKKSARFVRKFWYALFYEFTTDTDLLVRRSIHVNENWEGISSRDFASMYFSAEFFDHQAVNLMELSLTVALFWNYGC